VARVLDEARARASAGSLGVLFAAVGKPDAFSTADGAIEFAIPLTWVHAVILQPATRPLPVGPPYLCELLDFHGEPVCVLDVARHFGIEAARPPVDRHVILLTRARREERERGPAPERDRSGVELVREMRLALSVDEVRDPALVPREAVTPGTALGGAMHPPLDRTLSAVVKTERGPVPVVNPEALFSAELLAHLPGAIAAVLERAEVGVRLGS
jgi:chemotaxis signal transduction protein